MSRLQENLRVIHIADVHLGYRRFHRLTREGFNQREVDVNNAFREAVDRVIALKPDLVLIAGDLFHSVRPSNSVLAFCFRQLAKLTKSLDAPVVLVAGNHDTPRRVDTGSVLQLFKEIESVYVADRRAATFVFEELDTAVTCLPHAALRDPNSLALGANDNCRFNILVAHLQVGSSSLTDFGGVELPLGTLKPREWDYVALGHVHTRQLVAPNATYSGALEHTGTNIWMEAREVRGFFEIELPGAKRIFHQLTSPREVTLLDPVDLKALGPEEALAEIVSALERVPGGVEGKILKLELRNLSRSVFRQLDHRELRRWRARALNLTLDIRQPVESQRIGATTLPGTARSLRMELEEYCKGSVGTKESPEVIELLGRYLERTEEQSETP